MYIKSSVKLREIVAALLERICALCEMSLPLVICSRLPDSSCRKLHLYKKRGVGNTRYQETRGSGQGGINQATDASLMYATYAKKCRKFEMHDLNETQQAPPVQSIQQ